MGLSKIKTEICVHGYESAWLSRWTRTGTEFELQDREDGQLLKESTDSMKPKGKMSNGCLDLFPNPYSVVQRVEIIPDMNKEPPIVADSIDGDEGETSRSPTQTKNVEHFLSNNTNTQLLRECKRIRLDPETNSRSQVKRLKTAASDCSENETKSMMVVEGPSGMKMNDFFLHRILKCGINKPRSRRNKKPSTSQGGEDVTHQHPWIQRWCKQKASETREPKGGQEGNPKDTVLEKQFPSIAAMALMGKALSGLNPSGPRKINSLFIWNDQDLR